jgi:CRP-like cAMP-binding protein
MQASKARRRGLFAAAHGICRAASRRACLCDGALIRSCTTWYPGLVHTAPSLKGAEPWQLAAGTVTGLMRAQSLSDDPRQNNLLAALPHAEWTRWTRWLEPCDLPLGTALYESGCRLGHAYFPTTAIVSLLHVLESGASTEIAVVGREGVVGISLFMGGETTPSRAVVQSAGMAFRLRADLLIQAFNCSAPVTHLLLRYTQALITQMAQTAVCNRRHSLDQQLCRWLLLSLDRLPGNELVMTQELIANMLGVRREGVTEAAGHLQQDGLIRYQRGHITILNRPGLESRACECYAVLKGEYERLLPARTAT